LSATAEALAPAPRLLRRAAWFYRPFTALSSAFVMWRMGAWLREQRLTATATHLWRAGAFRAQVAIAAVGLAMGVAALLAVKLIIASQVTAPA
jgi:hypothetical protein